MKPYIKGIIGGISLEIKKIKIPLPPLEIQEQIVAELDGYQNIITGARQIGQSWKPKIDIDPEWEMVKLGEVCEIGAGNSAPQGQNYFEKGKYHFFRISDVGEVHICTNLIEARDKVNEFAVKDHNLRLYPKNTILFPKSGASTFLNHRVMLGVDGYVSSHLATIQCNNEKAIPQFVFHLLCAVDAKKLTDDQNYPSLRLDDIKKIEIPLPPLEIQEQIVEKIEAERALVESAKKLIEIYEQKIKEVIAKLWGE